MAGLCGLMEKLSNQCIAFAWDPLACCTDLVGHLTFKPASDIISIYCNYIGKNDEFVFLLFLFSANNESISPVDG